MSWEVALLDRLNPDRDVQILLDIHEHGVLTTGQLAVLHFGSERACRRRLQVLAEDLRLVERFRPLNRRDEPWHFTLGERGAKLVAELLGREVRAASWRRADALALVRSLPHRRAAVNFFCALVAAASDTMPQLVRLRTGGEGRPVRASAPEPGTLWLGERSCRHAWSDQEARPYGTRGAIVPDGFALLELEDRSLPVFLELDRGTESDRLLADKLARYGWLAGDAVVLVCFTDAARAARWSPEDSPVQVLVSCLADHLADPWGRVWRPPHGGDALSLTELVGNGEMSPRPVDRRPTSPRPVSATRCSRLAYDELTDLAASHDVGGSDASHDVRGGWAR